MMLVLLALNEDLAMQQQKRQVRNIKLVPRSVVCNTQELRVTLPNQAHSPFPAW